MLFGSNLLTQHTSLFAYVTNFRAECDRLKQAHSEDSVMAESEKQQALLMAQQVKTF